MEDYFGRVLEEGMIVVHRASGRYSEMELGVVEKDLRVRFKSGRRTVDGHNCVWMGRNGRAVADKTAKLLKDLSDQDEVRRAKNRNKLKKNELVRFGIFSAEGAYMTFEVRLGHIKIKHTGKEYDNAWLQLASRKDINRENCKLRYDLLMADSSGEVRLREWYLRDCKVPTKTVCHDVFTRSELEHWLGPEVMEHIEILGEDND